MARRFQTGDRVRVKGGKGWGKAVGVIKSYSPKTKQYKVYFHKGLPSGKHSYINRYGKRVTLRRPKRETNYFMAGDLVKVKK